MEEIFSRILSRIEYKFDGICASIIRILTKFTEDTTASGVFVDNIAQESCERLFLTIVSDGSDRHPRDCYGRVSDKKVYAKRIFA